MHSDVLLSAREQIAFVGAEVNNHMDKLQMVLAKLLEEVPRSAMSKKLQEDADWATSSLSIMRLLMQSTV